MAKKLAKKKVRNSRLTPENLFSFLPLRVVRLLHLDAHVEIKNEQLPTQATIEVTPEIGFTKDQKTLHCNVAMTVTGKPKGADGDCSIARIVAKYQCVFDVKHPNVDAITKFGEHIVGTGVLIAWPYLRELVASTTARMGIPALLIPVYRPTPFVKDDEASKAANRPK